MKKILPVLLMLAVIGYILSTLSCRERVASRPGAEPTATTTPTAPPFFIYYYLDTPAEVAAVEVDGATASYTTNPVYSGTGCAQVNYSLTSTNASATFRFNISSSNFTGKIITAHVYIPAALHAADYQMQVWIMQPDFSGWKNTYYDLNSASITPDAWNTLTYTPVGVGEATVGEFGLQLELNGQPAISGSFYVDEVTVN
jgi:hypothetical protein